MKIIADQKLLDQIKEERKTKDVWIIYLLHNSKNGKAYVGQTLRTLERRWANECGYKGNEHLQNAIKKYTTNAFQYEILQLAYNQEEANWAEDYWAIKYNVYDRKFGYNIKECGSNGKLSEKTKEKLRKAHIGKSKEKLYILTEKQAEWARQEYINGKSSNKISKELNVTQTTIINILKNKTHKNDLYIPNIRGAFETQFKKGNIPPNIGKNHTEEARQKMSIAKAGKKPNQKAIDAAKKVNTGKKRTAETKAKISTANKGKVVSEEQRKKISKALKGNIPWNKGIAQTEEQKSNHSRVMKQKYANGELTPHNKKITFELSYEIYNKYKNGISMKQLAKQYELGLTTIKRYIKKCKEIK